MSGRSGGVRQKTEHIREKQTGKQSEQEGESVTSIRADISSDHVVDGSVKSLDSEESVRRHQSLVEGGGVANQSHKTKGEDEEYSHVVKRTKESNNGVSVHRRSNHRKKREDRLIEETQTAHVN